MLTINKMSVGTKLAYWHDQGAGFPATLCYAEVLKVGKKKVQVRDEFGTVAWKYPHFFDYTVSDQTWNEIYSTVRRK